MDQSGEFSDAELDEFEESVEDVNPKKKGSQPVSNKPYDEEYEVSQDLSMAESFDGRDAKGIGGGEKKKQFRNDRYDESYDVSQSVDQSGYSPVRDARAGPKGGGNDPKGAKGASNFYDAKGSGDINPTLSKSNSTRHNDKPFDEAVDLSQSGSDESVDTVTKRGQDKKKTLGGPQQPQQQQPQQQQQQSSAGRGAAGGPPGPDFKSQQPKLQSEPKASAPQQQPSQLQQTGQRSPKREEESGSENGDETEESYEHIEGAYNPKDYSHLNVTAEVKDLFQYIERYKPMEVELPTVLKCFIPEYIPAIGEMDAFLKVPRPDDKPDDLGLKFLDEPSSAQSDPTVLELQLRALSKKVQYGDVAVRSIEDAAKNPAAIDRWIQSISDLHRTKPPPQVFYKKPMPDMDILMDVWPSEFEAALDKMSLPSPDLDLSLAEYAKLLCSLLDIPTYDNPIEAIHLMFSLFIEFRNNPHFQANSGAHGDLDHMGEGKDDGMMAFGNADVLELK